MSHRPQHASRAALFAALALHAVAQNPGAIPAPDIADRYVNATAIVRTAAAHAGNASEVDEIQRGMPGLTKGVSDLTAFTRSALARPSAVDSVDELRANWRPVTAQLNLWSGQLNGLAKNLEADGEALRQEEAAWSQTLNTASEASLPQSVQDLVRATWTSIQNAQKPVAARRANVIALQAEVAEQQIQTQIALERIADAERLQRRGLFAFDAAPIWRLHEDAASRYKSPEGSGVFEFSAESRELRQKMRYEDLSYLAIFAGSVLISWLSLRFLSKRNAEAWAASDVPGIRSLALALRRPVSSAVFLATALNALVVEDPPSWMIAIAGLSLLIPSLRLLPGLIAHSLEHAVYLLVVAFVCVQLFTSIPETSVFLRPAWLILQLATAALLWWLRGVLRDRATARGTWGTFLRVLTRGGFVLALAAALCNIFGAFQLSSWLIRVVLSTYYIAGVVRGVLILLSGLVSASLRADRVVALPALAERSAWVEVRVIRTLNVVAAISFVVIVLYMAGLLEPVHARIDTLLDAPFGLGSLSFSLRRLLAFSAAVAISFVVSGALRMILEVAVYPRTHYQAGERDAFSKIVHYTVLVLGFLFAFAAGGVQLSNIAILAGGLSVGVGLGLQQLVSNFVSGLILLFERPIQAGDLIAVGSTTGKVQNIGIRASVIRTFDGADVTVPNGALVSGDVTNWSRDDAPRRIEVKVRVAYSADSKVVIQSLLDAARSHPDVLQGLDTQASLDGFGDYSQDFSLRFWTVKAVAANTASEVRGSVVQMFREKGIEMARTAPDLMVPSAPAARKG